MHIAVEIADGVVTTLMSRDWEPEVSPVRAYRMNRKMSEIRGLRCTVVPSVWSHQRADRISDLAEVSVDMALQQIVDPEDLDQVDDLMTLMWEIDRWMSRRRLDGVPYAVWHGSSQDELWVPEHLDEHQVLTAVLRITYRSRTGVLSS